MAKPGKKKKVLFVLEIIVLLLFIGGLYVYGQISSRLDKIEQPELKKEKIVVNQEAPKMTGYKTYVLFGIDTRGEGSQYSAQNSDTMMVEKIQTTVVNTIPLWKSQMVLALGVEHASQAAQAQRQVTDMTNDLLRKNAEVLKVASVEAAKESERGIVDLETLQNTNASLISTLDEVMQIQADGRMKRQAAEVELRKMEDELKNKLLEIR